jgi:DNA-binding beta-propeller fold protein YncE
MLTPDFLIITDFNNKAVKMVDISRQSVSDQLQLDDAPWDITTVTSTELAVTLPYKHTILLISIASNKLTIKHTMKVNGRCHGISCYQDKLVVTYRYPAKLQILLKNGTILTTIDGKILFKEPLHVTCNKRSIYVSDYGMKSVTRLNWQGDVIGSYSCTGLPRGISLSNDGTVFMCDVNRNVIEEISEDCSTGKVVLQDVIYPYAVCWSEERKELYLSCNNNDFLYIYELGKNGTKYNNS